MFKFIKNTVVLLLLFYPVFPIVSFADDSFLLVSEDEYLKQLKFKPEMIAKKIIPDLSEGFPKIVIKLPVLTSEVKSPTNIHIIFITADDATILVDSLEVLYGWLSLDITDRIIKHAQLSPTGFVAKNVALPTGEHAIKIRISDTKGREVEKNFTILITSSRKATSN